MRGFHGLADLVEVAHGIYSFGGHVGCQSQIEIQQFQSGGISDSFRFSLVDHFLRLAHGDVLFQCFYSHMYACFCNNVSEVTKEKIDASVHCGQTINRQMVLLMIFKLKK